jgi:hypothetical protein
MHGKGVYKVKNKQFEAEWKNGQRVWIDSDVNKNL